MNDVLCKTKMMNAETVFNAGIRGSFQDSWPGCCNLYVYSR